METVLKAIADWIKGILTAGIMSNLSGLFDAVNEQVGDIAQQVGTQPSSFEPRVFAMIESLSRNVVLPIAGIILTFIACYELIEMITQHNSMAQFEPALIMRWIFKTAVSVWLISNTFDIVMAVFDLTQKVVSDSSGIIAGNTRVNDIGLSMLEASLMQMDVGPLFGLFLQSFFIGITMRILSIVLNQLHGLPDDQIFQPVLLHGLFVAALTPLDVGTFIIIVGASGGTGSAFAEHQRTTLAAEQLGGQQIFLVCLATGRGTLVLIQTLLHPVKQVFRNNNRNCIRHNDIPERQFANVPTVLQHSIHAAVGHFAAQHIADTLVVEKVYDLHHSPS